MVHASRLASTSFPRASRSAVQRSRRPTRARTWAPRGETPVLHETFNWKSLSIIGGLALWRFYFQIHAGSIKSLQVVEFLRHLQGFFEPFRRFGVLTALVQLHRLLVQFFGLLLQPRSLLWSQHRSTVFAAGAPRAPAGRRAAGRSRARRRPGLRRIRTVPRHREDGARGAG